MGDGRRAALLKKRAEVLEQHQLYQATYDMETFMELSKLLEKVVVLLNSAAEQTHGLLNHTKAGLGIIDRELADIDIEEMLADDVRVDGRADTAVHAEAGFSDHVNGHPSDGQA